MLNLEAIKQLSVGRPIPQHVQMHILGYINFNYSITSPVSLCYWKNGGTCFDKIILLQKYI